MKHLFLLGLLICLGCSKGGSGDGSSSAVPQTSAAPLASAVGSSAASATPSAAPAAVAGYQGSFSATRRRSQTTTKQGAPSAWDKDDGQKYSGDGKLELSIGRDGTVKGSLSGALGERALRGRLEGDELRAQLLPAGDDVTAIQNGSLLLKRDGQAFKGTLTAGTGDALLMRQADVVLAPSGS